MKTRPGKKTAEEEARLREAEREAKAKKAEEEPEKEKAQRAGKHHEL